MFLRITRALPVALAIFTANTVFAATPTAEMKTVLDELTEKQAEKKAKPIEILEAKEARKQPTPTDAVMSVMKEQKKKSNDMDLAKVDDMKIDGAAGKLEARVYQPAGKTPMPLIVYFHGGGFVIADKDVYDASARALAKQTGSIVLSVDYRLAPEHKFPAAHDDAFAAYKWALSHAKDINANPARIAVAGESAGANLALNVAIRARDEKVQAPVHQLLVYPVASSNMDSASYKEFAGAKPLNKPMMDWFVKNYLNNPAEAQDKRINLVAADLTGLPATTLITAQIDPLNSEGKELAGKLQAAGNKVQYKDFVGVTHEFFGMGPVLKEARDAQGFAAAGLKQDLSRQ